MGAGRGSAVNFGAMNKPYFLIATAIVLSLTACSGAQQSPEAGQAPPPAQEQGSAQPAAEEQKGTEVNVGSEGVDVKSEKVDVKVSADSGKVHVKL